MATMQTSISRTVNRALKQIRGNGLLVSNSISLIAAQGLTYSLGALFWAISVRYASTEAIGIGSGAVSAMLLAGSFGTLGLDTMVVGYLPLLTKNRGAVISSIGFLASIAGVVLGIAMAFVSVWLGNGLHLMEEVVAGLAIFSIGAGLTALAIVLDQSAVGMLRGDAVLSRNGLQAVSKVVLLVAATQLVPKPSGYTLLGIWVLSTLISLVVPMYLFLRHGGTRSHLVPRVSALYFRARSSWKHYILNLALIGPGLVLPVIAASMVSAEANAYFYVSWMIANFLFVVPASMTNVLYAAAAGNEGSLAGRLRFTLFVSLVFSIVSVLSVIVFGRVVLSVFGYAYAIQGQGILIILAVAGIPVSIRSHMIALVRIRGAFRAATFWFGAAAIAEVAFALAGAHILGMNGLVLGWLLAVLIEGLCMATPVFAIATSNQCGKESSGTTPFR